MIFCWIDCSIIEDQYKLGGLRLRGNKFTETGLKILYASIFYDTSLRLQPQLCSQTVSWWRSHSGLVLVVLAMNATPRNMRTTFFHIVGGTLVPVSAKMVLHIPMAFLHNVGAVSAKMVLIKRHEFDMKRKMLCLSWVASWVNSTCTTYKTFPWKLSLGVMPELIDFIQYWGEFSKIEKRES